MSNISGAEMMMKEIDKLKATGHFFTGRECEVIENTFEEMGKEIDYDTNVFIKAVCNTHAMSASKDWNEIIKNDIVQQRTKTKTLSDKYIPKHTTINNGILCKDTRRVKPEIGDFK